MGALPHAYFLITETLLQYFQYLKSHIPCGALFLRDTNPAGLFYPLHNLTSKIRFLWFEFIMRKTKKISMISTAINVE